MAGIMILNDYFKFAFVRNPWDRLVSWFLWSLAENIYFNHISQTEDTKEIIVRSRFEAWNKGRDLLMNSQDSELKRKLFLEYKKGFTRFVEELRSSPLTYERRYDDISILENRLKGRWVLPQAKWLEAGTGSEIDYVGQFERLEKDFGCILKITKNKVSGLGHSGKIESKPDYKKFYTPKTQGIVRDIYAEDVEAFDYEF